MSFLDNAFRIFMFILPYTICFAAYIWMGKRAAKVPNKISKYAALSVIAVGLVYTIYNFFTSFTRFFKEDNFQYLIILIMVGVLAVASIIMAFGEPEEKNAK